MPLILGQPFLATTKAITDVKEDELVLWARDEELNFKTFDVMNHSLQHTNTVFFFFLVLLIL